MARKKGIHIGPRQLFLLLEAIAAYKRSIYEDLKLDRDRRGLIADEHDTQDLWDVLEEQWDALPARDRREAAKASGK